MPRRGPRAEASVAVTQGGCVNRGVLRRLECMDIEIMQHEPPYRVGVIVGSLSRESINRRLAAALQHVAPSEFEFFEISYADLPVYNRDFDADYPQVARDFKEAIRSADAVLFVTPSTTARSRAR
jgi:hypothetical protein